MSNWDITYEWSEKKKTTKIFHDKEAETVPRILGTKLTCTQLLAGTSGTKEHLNMKT